MLAVCVHLRTEQLSDDCRVRLLRGGAIDLSVKGPFQVTAKIPEGPSCIKLIERDVDVVFVEQCGLVGDN